VRLAAGWAHPELLRLRPKQGTPRSRALPGIWSGRPPETGGPRSQTRQAAGFLVTAWQDLAINPGAAPACDHPASRQPEQGAQRPAWPVCQAWLDRRPRGPVGRWRRPCGPSDHGAGTGGSRIRGFGELDVEKPESRHGQHKQHLITVMYSCHRAIVQGRGAKLLVIGGRLYSGVFVFARAAAAQEWLAHAHPAARWPGSACVPWPSAGWSATLTWPGCRR